MKLSNHLTIRLSVFFILIFSIWAAVYFFLQMKEIYDGIDEGLNNLRQEFILKANTSSDFIDSMEKYDPINMNIERITYEEAVGMKELYATTKVYFPTEEEEEEVRMLTTAFHCKSDGNYYKISFFTSTVEQEDLVESMLFLLIILWVTLALTLIIASKVIIKKGNKPFYKLLDNLQNFQLDKTQAIDLPQTSITEYIYLNNAVKSLLDENIKVFNEQKSFIENASHELQTPLAIVIGKIELLLNKEDMGKEQMEELNSILISLNRMKRLNNNMLLLSRIRNKHYITSEDVSINDLTEDILDTFEGFISHKGLSVHTQIEDSFMIKMSMDLAYILISNLIKNAIVHNAEGGTISIVISSGSFVIANTGEPFISDDVDIFKRYYFYSPGSKSSGLGLSIVKSIVDLYNLHIEYRYEGQHKLILSQKNKN